MFMFDVHICFRLVSIIHHSHVGAIAYRARGWVDSGAGHGDESRDDKKRQSVDHREGVGKNKCKLDGKNQNKQKGISHMKDEAW